MMLMVPAAMMWADNINEDKAKSMAQGFLQTNTRVRTAAANKPLKLAAQSTGYYAYNIGYRRQRGEHHTGIFRQGNV